MQGLALIDYDNFRSRDRKSKVDMELDADVIVDRAVRSFAQVFPDTRELDVRLYGGWTNEAGLPSRDASWMYELLPNLRRRRHGLIVRPTLATTMIRFPELLLKGTLRGHGRNQRQKMIDGMIGCDAIHMAREGLTRLSIVTDDDDLLPAVLSAYDSNTDVLVWIRARDVGSGMNDNALMNRGLRIHKLDQLGG